MDTASSRARWCIAFQDKSSFGTIVELACNVMGRAIFRVRHDATSGAHYLCIDGQDRGQISYLSARLLLEDITFHGTDTHDFEFCVDCASACPRLHFAPPGFDREG